MAALWPTYIKNVGIFLDSPKEGKTEKQTAEKLAKEYKTGRYNRYDNRSSWNK